MTFDPKWPHGHVTRDGKKARVICTDRQGYCSVIALISESGKEHPRSFHENGRCYPEADCPDDLINAPAPKRKVRVDGWLNVFDDGDLYWYLYQTREAADDHARDRIACIHIEHEVEEGEGL